MLLETQRDHAVRAAVGIDLVVASLAIASVLVMALAATLVVSRVEIRRPWLVGAALLALLALNYAVPVGRVTFDSRVTESLFYAAAPVQPDLLRRAAVRRPSSDRRRCARDYGTNLLGAMVGGCAEYLSLLTGFSGLLAIAADLLSRGVAARRN